MIVSETHDPALYKLVQERNLLRQYGLLVDCVQIGLQQGPTSFDKYVLWVLNHVAVANISQMGGRFRQEPIYVGNHHPPHFREVPDLMDRFFSTIHENWYEWSATELAAYGLWRLLWIHPFIEGNGRTARAICYYILCARSGAILPGRKIVPERIRETRPKYYAALRSADEAWENGELDCSQLEAYLADLLQAQLSDESG